MIDIGGQLCKGTTTQTDRGKEMTASNVWREEDYNAIVADNFATDYTLVIDNNQEGYNLALEIAHEAAGNVPTASDKFKEQFEDAISQVVERERENGNELIADLISQLLIGFGSRTFDDIARYYIDKDLEQWVHNLNSPLKTGN
jgi:hypothetical protein